MKVLLKKDLRKVGKKGDIVEVSDGYGANYVIAQGYGVLYTSQAQKTYAHEQEIERQAEAKRVEEAQKIADRLKGITLQFEANAGRRGEMIGNISFKEISSVLKKQYDISLDKKMLLDKNVLVNGFGNTSLKVEIHKGVIGEIKLHVSLKEKK